MEYEEIRSLIFLATVIFLLGPIFIFLYVVVYFKKRKRHLEEKIEMEHFFATELLKTQMEVREHTLETIGADLHDNVGQLLSLAALTLNAIDPKKIPDEDMVRINDAVALTKNSIEEMRLLGKLMQGEQLITAGLEEAIGFEMEYIRKLGVYEVELAIDNGLRPLLDSDRELILFRILQEALNNVIKHASAKKITISLKTVDDDMVLQIADDGKGFEIETREGKGMGLANIRKRANIIGAHILISSLIGKGTTVELNVPYANGKQAS